MFHRTETLANAISNRARSLTFYYVLVLAPRRLRYSMEHFRARALSQFPIGFHTRAARLSLRRYFPVFFARSTIVLTQCRLYAELSIFLSPPQSADIERLGAKQREHSRHVHGIHFAWERERVQDSDRSQCTRDATPQERGNRVVFIATRLCSLKY